MTPFLPLALVATAALLAYLLYPVLRPPLVALDEGTGPASRLAALEARKQNLYGAIRDLGFDLRTDKISRADYEREVDTLKREAVAVLAEIERLRATPPRGDERLEAAIRAARARQPDAGGVASDRGADRFCTRCGRPARLDDRFCSGCGAALEEPA